MGGLPNRFLRPPSVSLLRSAIPVGDDVVHIANEYRVMRLVEEAGLLCNVAAAFWACTARTARQEDRSETDQRVGGPFEMADRSGAEST